MRNTVYGLVAITLMAIMVASVMKSTPTGAQAAKPAVAAPETASALDLMSNAPDLPVTLTADGF